MKLFLEIFFNFPCKMKSPEEEELEEYLSKEEMFERYLPGEEYPYLEYLEEIEEEEEEKRPALTEEEEEMFEHYLQGEEYPYLEEIEEEEERPALPEEERKRLKKEYEKYWLSIYGVDPRLAERARAFREREIARAGGPEAIRRERFKKFEEKIKTKALSEEERKRERAARTLQKLAQWRRSHPCENLTPEQSQRLHPAQIIKLRVNDRNGQVHYVCYDIISLMNYLKSHYRDEFEWRDPTYNQFYSQSQIELIKSRYRQVSLCKETFQNFSVDMSQNGEVIIPESLYRSLIEREDVPYLIFRVSNVSVPNGRHVYVRATNYHRWGDNLILLPQPVLNTLGIAPGTPVTVEECSSLPKVGFITFHPESEKWYTLRYEDTDQITNLLTREVETRDVIFIGDTISIVFNNSTFTLRITDLRSQSGQRIFAGIPKFTEVKVEIR